MEETLDVMILGPVGAEVGRLLAIVSDEELFVELRKKTQRDLAVVGSYSFELRQRASAIPIELKDKVRAQEKKAQGE